VELMRIIQRRKITLYLLLVCLAFSGLKQGSAKELHVSVDGHVQADGSLSVPKDLTIKESSFCKSLVVGKYILPAKEGWWNWGMAPIYDEDGKLHIFNSSIPYEGIWVEDSIV